jgi:hypothetical protein
VRRIRRVDDIIQDFLALFNALPKDKEAIRRSRSAEICARNVCLKPLVLPLPFSTMIQALDFIAYWSEHNEIDGL